MNRETRNNIYEQLKVDEGVIYEIYNDHLGYPTFGVGHLITEEDPEFGQPIGTVIDEERVYAVFESDLDLYIEECRVLYGEEEFYHMPDEVKEILVNMMFNLGRTRLTKFKKMNAALLVHNWREAAKEGRDSLWYKQVTNRAERLMSRLEKVRC